MEIASIIVPAIAKGNSCLQDYYASLLIYLARLDFKLAALFL